MFKLKDASSEEETELDLVLVFFELSETVSWELELFNESEISLEKREFHGFDVFITFFLMMKNDPKLLKRDIM